MNRRTSLGLLALALVALGGAVGLAFWISAGGDSGDALAALEDGVRAADGEAPAAAEELEAPTAPEPAGSEPARGGAAEPQGAKAPVRESVADPELDGAIWVEGRVLLPDGTPPDEELFVLARGRRFEDRDLFRQAVERDGSFRVAFAPRSRWGRVVLESRYLVAGAVPRIDLRAEPIPPVVLEPRLGGRLVVRVEPPRGEDASAAAVELAETELELTAWDRASERVLDSSVANAEELLGEDLAVAFDALPPEPRYALDVSPESCVKVHRDSVPVVAGETTELVLALDRGVRIAGRVVDESGAPVQDAYLWGAVPDDPHAGRTETTDAEGRFTIAGLPAGSLKLTADTRGFVQSTMDLELAEGEVLDGLEIVLSRGGRVSGLVTTSAGEPVPAALLRVEYESNGAVHAFGQTWSDETGRFEFSGIEEVGPLVVTAAKDDAVARAADVAVGTADLRLVLRAGEELEGRVVDDRGEPVERFRILATPVQGPGAFVHFEDSRSRRKGFRDARGEFTLTGLRPGGWYVVAEARGFADSAVERVELPRQEPLVLTAPRHGTLRGRVVDAGGSPVAGARVRAGNIHWSAVATRYQENPPTTRSDDAGHFELDDVAPGLVHVVARAPGYAATRAHSVEVEAGQVIADVELVLVGGGTLTAELSPAAGDPEGRWVTVAATDLGYHEAHPLDDEGRLRVDDLAPGTYVVTLDPHDVRGGSEEEVPPPVSVRAQVRADEVTHVVLGAPVAAAVTVRGRITRGDEPLAGLDVRVRPRADAVWSVVGATRTDADGRYELSLAAPGEYAFVLGRDFDDQVTIDVDVPDRTVFERDIALPTGVVRGTVRGPDGAPFVGHRVRAFPEDGLEWVDDWTRRLRSAETDSTGRYALVGLEPGSWTVLAGGTMAFSMRAGPLAGGLARHGVEVADEPVEDVDFDLPAPGTLTGRVVFSDGAPLRGAWLGLRDGDGRPLPPQPGAYVDTDGRFRVEGVAPGEVHLLARGSRTGEEASGRAAVRAGETTTVELVVER